MTDLESIANWKPVVGYAGLYEVSRDGRVRRDGRLMTTYPHQTGYLCVSLCKNGVQRTYRAHRLVLAAFVGPCPDGMDAAHLNGNPHDNRIENLAWVTRKENASHKRQHGTHVTGERHGRHKLTESQVAEIRATPAAIYNYELAQRFGVATNTVSRIRAGVGWTALTLGDV